MHGRAEGQVEEHEEVNRYGSPCSTRPTGEGGSVKEGGSVRERE